MYESLTNQEIKQMFANAELGSVLSVTQSKVGFSNDIFFVDDKYVLKVGKSEEAKKSLKKEYYFCNLFKDSLPVPRIVSSNLTDITPDRPYIIYERIKGDNLYNHWHSFDNETRTKLIEQICSYLKIINSQSPIEYIELFKDNTIQTWQDFIVGQIYVCLEKLIEKGLIDEPTLFRVRAYVDKQKSVLKEEKMALTYFDPHFDNFIIFKNKIVGMVDFERVDYLSIDFVLDLVRRMVEYPDKYASEEAEKYINPKDYANLVDLYQKFYPELFEFENLKSRLDLYAVRYILKMWNLFPHDARAKNELEVILNHS